MPLLSRRTLLRGALGAAELTTTGPASPAAAASGLLVPARGGLYTPNASPLSPTALLRLPPGAVIASGWLAGQLQLELEGLCGKYQDASHFPAKSTTGWLNPSQAGWEEVPYWLRGFGDLGYVTGDAIVSNMSTADSANVVQFTDNGTADHLWRIL